MNDVTMAYKDGTQVRHIRSSSHQPVNIVSFHNHLHKSDINEVIKGSLWVLFSMAKFGTAPDVFF